MNLEGKAIERRRVGRGEGPRREKNRQVKLREMRELFELFGLFMLFVCVCLCCVCLCCLCLFCLFCVCLIDRGFTEIQNEKKKECLANHIRISSINRIFIQNVWICHKIVGFTSFH